MSQRSVWSYFFKWNIFRFIYVLFKKSFLPPLSSIICLALPRTEPASFFWWSYMFLPVVSFSKLRNYLLSWPFDQIHTIAVCFELLFLCGIFRQLLSRVCFSRSLFQLLSLRLIVNRICSYRRLKFFDNFLSTSRFSSVVASISMLIISFISYLKIFSCKLRHYFRNQFRLIWIIEFPKPKPRGSCFFRG